MTVRAERASGHRRAERGHLMVGLMALIAIMLIFSTMAFQAWEDVLRRDNEAEMIFRAEEIVRAIQRYRADHGGVAPLKLEDLIEPGPKGQYYLRKLYTDPLVPDGAWGLLHIGPGGQIIDPAALPEQAAGLEGGFGGGLGGRSGGLGSAFDNKKQGGPGNRGGAGQRQQGAGRRPGQLGGLQSQQSGAGGTTGLPIAGVRTLSTEEPFRHHKGFSDYSQWLFTYLDLEVQQVPGQGGRRGGRQGGARPGTPGSNQGVGGGLTQPPRLNPK